MATESTAHLQGADTVQGRKLCRNYDSIRLQIPATALFEDVLHLH